MFVFVALLGPSADSPASLAHSPSPMADEPAPAGAALASFMNMAEEMTQSLAEDDRARSEREKRSAVPKTPPEEPRQKPPLSFPPPAPSTAQKSKYSPVMPAYSKISGMPARPSTLVPHPPAEPPPGWNPLPHVPPPPPPPPPPPRKRQREEDTRVPKWHFPIGFQPRATSCHGPRATC